MLTTTLAHSWRAQPFTDWYTLPAWDSASLIANALEEFDIPVGATVLDPFCGAGDGLLAARLSGRNAVGMEANPFLSFAARAKTRPYDDLPQLRAEMDALLEAAESALETLDHDGNLQWHLAARVPPMPRLQSWISTRVVWKVLALRERITQHVSEENRDLPLLALASVLRGASHMRLSPHAYGSRDSKPFTPVFYHFDAKLRKMLADLESVSNQKGLGQVSVVEGDPRRQPPQAMPTLAALSVFAPPPLNDPDPTLQTRLELFFLGYVEEMNDLEELKAQLSFHEEPHVALRGAQTPAISRLADAVDSRPGSGGQAVRNYFENLLIALGTIKEMIAPQAPLVMSLSECVLSGLHVPVADMAVELAHAAGYTQAEVRVLHTRRHPAARGGLKECAVVVR